MPSHDPKANNSEPTFGGMPTVPAPEVFGRAQQNNPDWYKILYEGYKKFAQRPENAGIYADPEQNTGATIQQIWLLLTALSGIAPYCVLAKPLPAASTQRVTRVVNSSAKELVQWLMAIQKADKRVVAALAYYDGQTGHCINLKSYDRERDRFIYHDPWPERSLLAKENNAAGVDAVAEDEAGTRWSITSQELERVAFAAFLMPWQWARNQGQKFELFDAEWRESTFFKAFHVKQLVEKYEDDRVVYLFSAGPFGRNIALWVVTNKESGRIQRASLGLTPNWIINNFTLALDLIKGFVKSFAPAPDQTKYAEIATTFGKLRDPQFMLAVKNSDPNESDAVQCVHAFMGDLKTAEVTTDFARFSIGAGEEDDDIWRRSLAFMLF
jgi:hypothetical protein